MTSSEFYGLYGAIMLFWGLVLLIGGFKFKSVRLQCWGVAPLCFIASLFALNHWYNWEINPPNFICTECGSFGRWLWSIFNRSLQKYVGLYQGCSLHLHEFQRAGHAAKRLPQRSGRHSISDVYSKSVADGYIERSLVRDQLDLFHNRALTTFRWQKRH